MLKKKIFGTVLMLLLIGIVTLVFNVQNAKASRTIYIRADGSVEGTDKIQRDGDVYTFTGNIYDEIVVERDNIVVDGAGYTVQGTEKGIGIYLSGRSNVTIKSTAIKGFEINVYLEYSSNNTIYGNHIADSHWSHGIYLWESSNNVIYGNNITDNWSSGGIILGRSSNNKIYANNILHNEWYGISLVESSDNTIYRNKIANNTKCGIRLWHSSINEIYENQLANNGLMFGFYGGVFLTESSNNAFYHNNFFNNAKHVHDEHLEYSPSLNTWDDSYPSGGNYWDNYTGIDLFRGLYQNETGNDGIGDTAYVIDTNNQDRYPLMSPWAPPEHELIVSITAPSSLRLDSSSSLAAIVTNQGLNDEVNVELSIHINGTIVDSKTISLLQAGNSYTLTYPWTPTAKGTYNVTAYVSSMLGETSIENNKETKFVIVLPPPEIGVKAGDWIKITYTITSWPAGQPRPVWLKLEFLSVEGTSATVRVTMHMSDGTEQNATVLVDVVAGGGEAFGLSGFVIPANSKTGDSIYMSGYGNITIAGETTRTYAGASRTVVHASFSQYGTQLTYYWDKKTGVMVEATVVSGTMTGTAKATETNMWQTAPGFPIDPIMLSIPIAIAIVIVIAVFLVRRKKRPTEAQKPETLP